MAFFVQAFSAVTSADLVTAVNTFLATLTNPTIRQLALSIYRVPRRNGVRFELMISYSDGGAALATPFLIRLDTASSMAALQTAVQAAITANGSYFWAGTRLGVVDNEDNADRSRAVYGLTPYNATAGASANWLSV